MPVRKKRRDTRGIWLRDGIYWMDATIDGKRTRVSLKTKDLAEALTTASRIKSEPSLASSDSLNLYLASLKQRGMSRMRMEMVGYAVPMLMRAANASAPHRVTTAALQRWIDSGPMRIANRDAPRAQKNQAPLNEQSIISYIGMLSLYLKWLAGKGHLRTNPCDGLRLPKLPPSRRQAFLTPDEAGRCIAECQNPELKFCLFAGLHAGLRKAEVIACRPKWFDLKQGLLHVQNEDDFTIKDRENRTIPLTDQFREFLGVYGLRKPYMIRPNVTQGKAVYRYDFKKSFNAHMKSVGLERFTFHDLRRTFASLLVSAGVSIYKVSKWLGDGIGVVEKHYGHLLPNDDEINKSWTSTQQKPSPGA